MRILQAEAQRGQGGDELRMFREQEAGRAGRGAAHAAGMARAEAREAGRREVR